MSTLDPPVYFCTSLAIKKGPLNTGLFFKKNHKNQIDEAIFSFKREGLSG